MTTLNEWPVRQPALIIKVEGGEATIQRLAEQGIHVGAEVEVLGAAPFRGPILVRTKEAVVAMRRGEAKCVQVEPSNP
jgi:ferrous iron transport protein A